MKLVHSLLANRIVNKSEFLNDTTWGTTPEQRLFYWCTWVWSFISGNDLQTSMEELFYRIYCNYHIHTFVKN